MHLVESHLQSKYSAFPDDGGEDKIFFSEYFAAVIDGATAKTGTLYDWEGKKRSPGDMASLIIAKALTQLDPDLPPQEACHFLDQQLYAQYEEYGITQKAADNPHERFTASIALLNRHKRYVVIVGNCQAVIDDNLISTAKQIDILNAEARSKEIHRLITAGLLTESELLSMDIQDDPGRKILFNPPPNSPFPGLIEQGKHQNNAASPLGYLTLDGFADFTLQDFHVYPVAEHTQTIVLASDGYPAPTTYNTLKTLKIAEENLRHILENDPCCYTLYKGTKGKGKNHSFDDRAYIRVEIT